MKFHNSIYIFCLSICMAAAASANVIYVQPLGDETNGTSWATAFTNLRDAIDAASINDTIALSSDTFYVANSSGGCFGLPSIINGDLSIFGGFVVGNDIDATTIRNRSFLRTSSTAHPCWPLPCNNSDMTVIVASDNERKLSSGAFINIYSDTDAEVLIDGLMFKSGQQVISCREADLVVRNSVFEESTGYGGVISLVKASVDMARSSFRNNNLAASGCLMYAKESDVLIEQSEFRSNTASGSPALVGSAFFFRDSVRADINNSLFFENESQGQSLHRMKVLDADVNDSLILTNCSFSSNMLETDADAGWYSVIVINNTIIDNEEVLDHMDNQSATLSMKNDIVPSSYQSIPSNLFTGSNIFTNEGAGDLTLTSTSPARDAGDSNLYEGGPGDILINKRIHDTNIDLGCYEFGAPQLTTKTEEEEETKEDIITFLDLFPNPVNDRLTLRADEEITGYVISDLNGRVARRELDKAPSQQVTIDVSNLPSGMYLIQITQPQAVTSRLFVVQ